MKLKVLLSVFVSLVLVIFSSSLVLGIEYGCEDCNPPPHAIDECSPCSGLRQAKCTGWCNGEWWPQCSEYKDPGCNSGLSCCWGLSCDNDHCCANDQLWMNSDCCDKWGAAGCGSGDDCCAGTVCTDNHCCNPGEEWDSEAGSCVPGDDPTDYCDEQTNPDGWCANKNANKPLCCGPGTNSHCEACCDSNDCSGDEYCKTSGGSGTWVCDTGEPCPTVGECQEGYIRICGSNNEWDYRAGNSGTPYCSNCNHCGDSACNCGETFSSCQDCRIDNDNDGYYANDPDDALDDCDDNNQFISPGRDEICWGGVDEDCDGKADCADLPECTEKGACQSCDNKDECNPNPCYENYDCKDTNSDGLKECTYWTRDCGTDGSHCCFPVCTYEEDKDCKTCPKFQLGVSDSHNFLPVNADGVGSVSVYIQNNGNVVYLGRSNPNQNNWGASMWNAYATSNCQYPTFGRGYVIIDTSCIEESYRIDNVEFIVNISEVRSHQSGFSWDASIWLDESDYLDSDDDWIIPEPYVNNPSDSRQIGVLTGWKGGVKRIPMNKQDINFGNYTRLVMRIGTDSVSDKWIAEQLDNCEGGGLLSCGNAANCQCRANAPPKCGGDPCGDEWNLKTFITLAGVDTRNCVGCMRGGYPATSGTHSCKDDATLRGPIDITDSWPVINISFCAPNCTLKCGQPDECGGTCSLDNVTDGFVSLCDNSSICYDTFGLQFGCAPSAMTGQSACLRGTGAYNGCPLTFDTTCGNESICDDGINNDCDLKGTDCADLGDCPPSIPECLICDYNISRKVYKTESSSRWHTSWNNDPSDWVCCLNNNTCVFQGTCHYVRNPGIITAPAGGGGNDLQVLCENQTATNKWFDVDGGQSQCQERGLNWSLSGETFSHGEYGSTANGGSAAFGGFECCGDDTDEHLITTEILGVNYTACCNDTLDGVDQLGICRTNPPGTGEICNDSIDNDVDGFIDGLDWDCEEGAGINLASPYRGCDDDFQNDAPIFPLGEPFKDGDDYKCCDNCTGSNSYHPGEIKMFDASYPTPATSQNWLGASCGSNFTDWQNLTNTVQYCCGDDPSEIYRTTIDYEWQPDYTCNTTTGTCPHSACCNETQHCIDEWGACQIGLEERLALCLDGKDNDCDGLIDIDDSNCSGRVWGYVFDEDRDPVQGALVKGSPPGMPKKYESNATTDMNGMYSIPDALIGNYSFIARKEGYDDNVRIILVSAQVDSYENFTLRNGSCHHDCTDYYGNCNLNCEGLDFGDDQCAMITPLCDFRPKGFVVTEPFTSGGVDMIREFTCCEGGPGGTIREYEKRLATVSGDIDLLIDSTFIVKKGGRDIILHLIVTPPLG